MKTIELTQGKVALVDDCDYEYLNQWKWHYAARGYAARKESNRSVYMHKAILEKNTNPFVGKGDHIDRDKLNNTRVNLRVVTHTENLRNCGVSKNNSSGYKGVSWCKSHSKWKASLSIKGKDVLFKRFVCKHEAAMAYNEAALKHHGEFAYQNVIPQQTGSHLEG